ncbi:DUF222 domain-containing protein [Amycolatopsis sp. cmx-11-51]|uniref:DUF222 domain-containing protein n=1 Tax=unclassified Amycolatopsis TaxID=2618356 RepID=UPI0039E2F194
MDQIVAFLKKIPVEVSPEKREGAEKILTDLAREAGPSEIAKAGHNLLAHLDPDGNEPKDPDPAEPRRELQRPESLTIPETIGRGQSVHQASTAWRSISMSARSAAARPASQPAPLLTVAER